MLQFEEQTQSVLSILLYKFEGAKKRQPDKKEIIIELHYRDLKNLEKFWYNGFDLQERENTHDIFINLQKEGLIKFVKANIHDDEEETDIYKKLCPEFWDPIFVIKTERDFDKMCAQFEIKANNQQPKMLLNRLFDRDERGNLYYDGYIIDVNKNADYYKIIDAILCTVDQNSETSHETVIDFMLKNYAITINSSKIHNSICEFFRRAKVCNRLLQNKLPSSTTKLIDTSKSTKGRKRIVLNNPQN